MEIPDLINAVFEASGGALIWLSVNRLWKEKLFRGVSIWPTMFFAVWGYWNLFYYPHLNQWLSFLAGLNIVLANTVWVYLMFKYRKN